MKSSITRLGFCLPYGYGPTVHYAETVIELAEACGIHTSVRSTTPKPSHPVLGSQRDNRVVSRKRHILDWLEGLDAVVWFAPSAKNYLQAQMCGVDHNFLVVQAPGWSVNTDMSLLAHYSGIVCADPHATLFLTKAFGRVADLMHCSPAVHPGKSSRLPLPPQPWRRCLCYLDSATVKTHGARILMALRHSLDTLPMLRLTLAHSKLTLRMQNLVNEIQQQHGERFLLANRPVRQERTALCLSHDFVLCASCHDSFGVYATEAMQCGRPVLAFTYGPPRSCILQDKLGWLIPCSPTGHNGLLLDLATMTKRIEEIVSGDRPLDDSQVAEQQRNDHYQSLRDLSAACWRTLWGIPDNE